MEGTSEWRERDPVALWCQSTSSHSICCCICSPHQNQIGQCLSPNPIRPFLSTDHVSLLMCLKMNDLQQYTINTFFLSEPVAFRRVYGLESYSRTSGESNHHRQSVSDTRVPRYQLSHEDDSTVHNQHQTVFVFEPRAAENSRLPPISYLAQKTSDFYNLWSPNFANILGWYWPIWCEMNL